MKTVFRWLYWKFRGNRLLAERLKAMTLPELNLAEARIMAAGEWTPDIGDLLEQFRAEKVA